MVSILRVRFRHSSDTRRHNNEFNSPRLSFADDDCYGWTDDGMEELSILE